MSTETKIDKLFIQHPDGKGTGATPCIEFCFFYNAPRNIAKIGYADLLSYFIEREALDLKWFKTNTMKLCKRIDGLASDQMNSFILSTEFEKDGDIGIEQHSGPNAENYHPPSLKLFSEQLKVPKSDNINRTFVRLCLPCDKARDPRSLVNLAIYCVKAQSLYCGHAGFSWYWNTGDTILEEEIANKNGFLRRHPCMGYSDPFTYHFFIGQGLFQIGWLTFLGPTLSKNLGAIQDSRDNLPESATVVDLKEEHSIIFIAGDKPILGSKDPKNSGFLAPYRAIGQATQSLRLQDDALDFLDIPGFEDEDELRDWYLRFFGDSR